MAQLKKTDPTPEDESRRRPAPVMILTGARLAGKTRTCQQIAQLARRQGWSVAGLVSSAVFLDRKKVGILVADLGSDRYRHLALIDPDAKPSGLRYKFDGEALAWASDVLRTSPRSDLLIIDELGPLEVLSGEGFVSAFGVLRKGDYRLGIVVVRPELVAAFQRKLGRPCAVRTVTDFTTSQEVDQGKALLSMLRDYLE